MTSNSSIKRTGQGPLRALCPVGRQDQVLEHHAPDVVVYDVLPPVKYESAAAYRRSWGDWQPHTQGEGKFELQDFSVVSGNDVYSVHCFVQRGGMLQKGETF